MQKVFTFIFSLAVIAGLVIAPNPSGRNLTAQLLPETTTPEQLKIKYDNETLKILIIPGHTNKVPGAQYRNLREFDINNEMARELNSLFKIDSRIEAYTLGDVEQYLKETDEIESFLKNTIQTAKKFASEGSLVRKPGGIQHVRASYSNALRLYGINKWSNDNGIDLVLHVHFNDHPGHIAWLPGKYNGFAIFIPEKQLPNHRASLDIAQAIHDQLATSFPVSDHPLEDEGIIESQDLIAVGTKASLFSASALIEYEYIYESQLASEKLRPLFLRELAHQTYFAIKKYFEPESAKRILGSPIFPYVWQKDLHLGMRNDPDVFSLQLALTRIGFYPPEGFSKNHCPPTGNFGPCTEKAVMNFQLRHQLPITGIADGKTLSVLSIPLLPSFFTALK